jgi:hypothetical protein
MRHSPRESRLVKPDVRKSAAIARGRPLPCGLFRFSAFEEINKQGARMEEKGYNPGRWRSRISRRGRRKQLLHAA